MFSDFPLSTDRRPKHYVEVRVKSAISKFSTGRSRKTLVDGRYLLLDEVGRGVCGSVNLVADLQTSKPAALKIRLDTKENRRFGAEPFALEMEALRRLNHPDVPHIIDSGTFEGKPYFVMEYIYGPNLHQFMLGGYSGLRSSLSAVSDLCLVLDYAHQRGVLHRDIKPKNVMVDVSGDLPRIALIDFGLAKLLDRSDPLVNFPEAFGNPLYQPPHRELVSPRCNQKVDIYSAGMLLYDLAISHGRLSKVLNAPKLAALHITGSVLSHDIEKGFVPECVGAVIRRATSSSPIERFQSALEMQEAIEGAIIKIQK